MKGRKTERENEEKEKEGENEERKSAFSCRFPS